MGTEKMMVIAVQTVAIGGSLFRIVYLIFKHLGDEDQTMRNNKIKNVIIILILIELIVSFASMIENYYT